MNLKAIRHNTRVMRIFNVASCKKVNEDVKAKTQYKPPIAEASKSLILLCDVLARIDVIKRSR